MDKDKILKTIPFFDGFDVRAAEDPLTQVLRRETLIKYGNWLLENQHQFSMMMIDIDNFKNINDNYGHTVGDIALSRTANFLLKVLGEVGIVGRYGGDEFMAIVDGITDYDEIWSICHNLTYGIGSVDLDDVGVPPLSLTIGVVRSPKDGVVFDDLFTYMDKALYRGKTKGRNCFIIYLPEKHKDLFVASRAQKAYDSMYLHGRIFEMLNMSDDSLYNIKFLLETISHTLMIDHLCVQSNTQIIASDISSLSKAKVFSFIPNSNIDMLVNETGYININKVDFLKKFECNELIETMDEQHIKASFLCKIDCREHVYGYLRADMADTVRIWQINDMDILVSCAKALGMLLYLKGEDLDNLIKDKKD